MKYIPRQIESELLLASKHFSGLILTGPRRAELVAGSGLVF